MRILILGASGYLGSRLFMILQKYGNVFGTFNSNGFVSQNMAYWDGDSKLLLHIFTELKPELVINCSGFAEVDQSERNPEKAFYLNAIVPHYISTMCQELNIKYVHISTDHYIGGKTLFLSEEMFVTCPNVYSASKLLGENYILASNSNSIVVRANFFHFTKNSSDKFLDRCLNLPNNGTEIHGFQDIFYTPISTIYLSSAILTLINQDFEGLIHIASSERISKYIFLKEIFRHMHKNQAIIHPRNWNDGQLKATRPENMALSNKLFRSLVNESIPTINEMIKTELEFAEII